MKINSFPPLSVDWDTLNAEKHNGETGFATVKSKMVGEIQIRKVEYSNNYCADHWCEKGHIIYVLEGELIIEHKDHSIQIIGGGMSYFVGDNSMSHKARSKKGAKVLIID